MQNISKDSDQSSVLSTSPCATNRPSWRNSNGSQFPPASLSKGLSLRMEYPPQHSHNMKQLGLQTQDRDSSSTQSTGQSHSHHDPAAVGGVNPAEKRLAAQSGYNDNYGKPIEGNKRSVLSLGTPDFVLPSQLEFNQSVAHIVYPYTDPFFGGLLATYGPQTIIHPQMVGMVPARIPLPLDLTEDEPIFVNAKQYHGILRRRQYRAKLEARNKLVKTRKPYLHESRHLHALKRARGSGGRFLNTKKLQESKPNHTATGQFSSVSSQFLHLGENLSESEMRHAGAPATSCSDITSVSNNDDIFRQPDLRFSGYPLHFQHGGTLMCNGSQPCVPVMR